MVRDRPPEGDRPGAHWYGEHVQYEAAIEKERREYAPAATPERWRSKHFERRGIAPADRPAPFDSRLARQVPDRTHVRDRTRGVLDVKTGPNLGLESGYGAIMDRLKRRSGGWLPAEHGFTRFNEPHVETQAAAYLRMSGRREATLYVNQQPCAYPRGCDPNLPRMLPEGARLTVYGPAGFTKVYRGAPDEVR